jgi:hypothetical protein
MIKTIIKSIFYRFKFARHFKLNSFSGCKVQSFKFTLDGNEYEIRMSKLFCPGVIWGIKLLGPTIRPTRTLLFGSFDICKSYYKELWFVFNCYEINSETFKEMERNCVRHYFINEHNLNGL